MGMRERLRNKLNLDFRAALARQMRERFGVEVSTEWDFIGNRIVTARKDGRRFTAKQVSFIASYEAGYTDAMSCVEGS